MDAGVQLDAIQTNLVDAIWTEANGRPKPNPRPIYIHDIAYAGNTRTYTQIQFSVFLHFHFWKCFNNINK